MLAAVRVLARVAWVADAKWFSAPGRVYLNVVSCDAGLAEMTREGGGGSPGGNFTGKSFNLKNLATKFTEQMLYWF